MTLPRPRVEFLDETRAQLLAPYAWTHELPVIVPEGFVTDGATVPAPFWWPVGHPYRLSLLQVAIPHDYELAQGVEWFDAWRRMRIRARYTIPQRWRRWAVLAGVWLRGWWRRVRA